MPRTRLIPDDRIFAAIHALMDKGGDRAVSFSAVATATGLAAPTLVQRYGGRDGMVKAARLAFWQGQMTALTRAVVETADKGAPALMKALAPPGPAGLAVDLADPELTQAALAWRGAVEAAIALRLGTGSRAREAAAVLVAAWQGQALWATDESGFKLKDLAKRLT
jgi:AcrR family transcriptional regulator